MTKGERLNKLIHLKLKGEITRIAILKEGYSISEYDRELNVITSAMKYVPKEEKNEFELDLGYKHVPVVDDSAKHDLKNHNVKLSELSGSFIQDLKKYGFIKY